MSTTDILTISHLAVFFVYIYTTYTINNNNSLSTIQIVSCYLRVALVEFFAEKLLCGHQLKQKFYGIRLWDVIRGQKCLKRDNHRKFSIMADIKAVTIVPNIPTIR